MPKCCKTECEKDGTLTLKLLLFAPTGDAYATAYMQMPVCEDHKMSEEAVRHTLMNNWEKICVGFDHVGHQKPVLARTMWAWVPWEEAEDFYKQNLGQPTKTVYNN